LQSPDDPLNLVLAPGKDLSDHADKLQNRLQNQPPEIS
jgi:hypothetical protein